YWTVWRHRFSSNVLANLTVVPVVAACAEGGAAAFARTRGSRRIEAVLLGGALVGVTLLVFGGLRPKSPSAGALLYAPLPLLLWAAVRFGPLGGSWAFLTV